MKILQCGFSQRMVNSQKLHYDYLTSETILRDVLIEAGHEVEHRKVEWGEDLSKFDVALIGIGPPRSFTARHVIGSSYALKYARKVVLYCGDWSITNAGTTVRSTLRLFESYKKWFRENLGEKMTDEQAESVRWMLRELSENSNLTLLAPMFPWGNHNTLMLNNLPQKLRWWDPSPFIQYPEFSQREKEKKWIYATLQDHGAWLEKLKLKWPVEKYGNRRQSGVGYVPEADIVQKYADSWGVLCPRYKMAGSGWWRIRFNYTTHVGSILLCDPQDASVMGPSYKVSYYEIEQMSPADLQGLAERQHEWLLKSIDTKEKSLERLLSAINE